MRDDSISGGGASTSQVRGEEGDYRRVGGEPSPQGYAAGIPNFIRDDTWFSVIIVFPFWLYVSVTLSLGVYGAVSLQLGPHSSVLMEANPIFVESVKVEQLNNVNPRPTLYGFYKTPPLNDIAHSSEFHNVSVNSDDHIVIRFLIGQHLPVNCGKEWQITSETKTMFDNVYLIPMKRGLSSPPHLLMKGKSPQTKMRTLPFLSIMLRSLRMRVEKDGLEIYLRALREWRRIM